MDFFSKKSEKCVFSFPHPPISKKREYNNEEKINGSVFLRIGLLLQKACFIDRKAPSLKIKWLNPMRLFALALVILYHFFPRVLPGGFIGVDLLFALSGFLIASLTIDEISSTDRFNLGIFLRKRLYRLLPTLVLCVGVSLLISLSVSPDYRAGIAKQIAAVFGFVTNQYEIISGGTYESQFLPHLFLHTWSLSIEAHFYLFWGLLLYLLMRYPLRIRENYLDSAEDSEKRIIHLRRKAIGRLLFSFSLFMIFCSMTRVYIDYRENTPIASLYFSDFTRFYSFFCGALVACLSGIRYTSRSFQKFTESVPKRLVEIFYFGTMGILLILATRLHYDSIRTYLFGLPAVSIMAALLLFSARVYHEKTADRPEPKAVTFLADSGYGIYLFHWPLAILLKAMLPKAIALPLTVIFSVLMGAFAYYILDPLISGRSAHIGFCKINARIGTILSLLLIVVLSGAGFHIAQNSPSLSSLEQRMWAGAVEQDIDQIISINKKAMQIENAAYEERTKGSYIIGDSILLGPRSFLLEQIPDSEVDAAGERTIQAAVDVLKAKLRTDTVRNNIILACGTNSLPEPEKALEAFIDLVPEGRRLIIVTPYDGRAGEDWTSSRLLRYERTMEEKYPFVTIADWHGISQNHPEFYEGTDLVHFYGIQKAYDAYAQMLKDAIAKAETKPKKGDMK